MKFVFTWTEVKEIIIAAIVLSMAFAIAYQGGIVEVVKNINTMPIEIFYAFVAVGIGFLAHELIGHKIVAQYMDMHGEFRLWRFGLMVAMASSLIGFVFAAPGAVYVSPRYDIWGRADSVSKKKMGIVSIAGPLVNLALAGIFYFLNLTNPSELFTRAVFVNVWLGIFNMLPIPPLDGSKVFDWDKRIWVVLFLVLLGLLLFL